jgi:lipooligosaccharide transport system ATP-binding protein
MIEARHLSKRYGDVVAVQDVSFEVGRGEVVGFLGPNGAGKTTTMRMLTGFLPPTDGTAVIAGHDIFGDPLAARRAIGYLPETLPLYPEMSVRSYLDYVARIKDVPRKSRRASVDRSLERCGLVHVAGRVIGTLSKGYRQRVGLAQAIVHDPAVLILDEPTVGLDPQIRAEIWTLVEGLRSEGATILMSTHYIEEAERLADEVALMASGRVIARGRPNDLIDEHAGRLTAEYYAPPERRAEVRAAAEAAGLPVRSAGPALVIVGCERAPDGLVPEDAITRPSSLEDVFIELTGEELE